MREEVKLELARMVKEILNESYVFTQRPYWSGEPPWRSESATDIGRLTSFDGTDQTLCRIGPIGNGHVGIVTHVGFTPDQEAMDNATGVQDFWLEKSGKELFTEFNRRQVLTGWSGDSCSLTWPAPFKPPIVLWPGETLDLMVNWGLVATGVLQGALWAYTMSWDYYPREYWR